MEVSTSIREIVTTKPSRTSLIQLSEVRACLRSFLCVKVQKTHTPDSLHTHLILRPVCVKGGGREKCIFMEGYSKSRFSLLLNWTLIKRVRRHAESFVSSTELFSSRGKLPSRVNKSGVYVLYWSKRIWKSCPLRKTSLSSYNMVNECPLFKHLAL